MKIKILLLLICFAFGVKGQTLLNSINEINADINKENKLSRDPVKFTHVPFLLLKINPLALFGVNNTLQYGAELVPPFGKFSFSFDYGKGKGSQSFNKEVKKYQSANVNTIYRGEIRMYFSDWYPFYALDKKPFGRYYAIEYVQNELERNISADSPNLMWAGTADRPLLAGANFIEKNQAIHLKIGKHFHINKFFFVDVFAGLGVGKFTTSETGLEEGFIISEPEIKRKFIGNNSYNLPNDKGVYFSTTSGFRLALVL